jgi:hypothetical protein
MDFATSLKHKRKELSITDLIGSLDVEEKARAKDTRGKGVVVTSSANVVQKNNSNKSHKKKKNKQENPTKTKQTTHFKKKNKGNCFVYGDPSHFASECECDAWPNTWVPSPSGYSGFSQIKPGYVLVGRVMHGLTLEHVKP